MAALVHDPALRDEPALLDAVTAAAAIALRERPAAGPTAGERRGAARLAGPGGRGRPAGAAAAGTRPARRRAAAPGGAVARTSACCRPASAPTPRRRRCWPRPAAEIAVSLAELRDLAQRPASGRGDQPRPGRGARVAGGAGAGAGPARRSTWTGRLTSRSRWRPTTSSARAWPTSASTPRRRRPRSTVSRATAHVVVEVVDDGVGGADTERGTGLRGLADRVEALGGRLRVWTPGRRRHPGTGGAAVRVAIAEDSVLLREGLARLLARRRVRRGGPLRRRRRAACRGARDACRTWSIVDIRLPPTHTDEGLRAAIELRAEYPGLGVLVLSQYVEVGLAMTAAGRLRRGRRLPAQGPDQRRRRSSSARCAGWPPAARRWTRSSSRRCCPGAAATTRWTGSRRASGRCWS